VNPDTSDSDEFKKLRGFTAPATLMRPHHPHSPPLAFDQRINKPACHDLPAPALKADADHQGLSEVSHCMRQVSQKKVLGAERQQNTENRVGKL